MTGGDAREVLAIRYCNRTTTRAENFLNHHLYGEPDEGYGVTVTSVPYGR